MEYILTKGKRVDDVVESLLNKKEIAFDTETNTTKVKGRNKNFKAVSVIISSRKNSYYIPLNHKFYDKNMDEDYFKRKFEKIFTNEDITLIGQGIDFDFHVLERIGIIPQRENYFDTLLASRMVNEEYENKLETILEKYLGVTDLHTYDEVVATVSTEKKKKAGLRGNNKATFDLVDVKKAAIYGTEDAQYLFDLKDILIKKLKEKELYDIYSNLIVPDFANVFYSMENIGVDIDKNELEKIDKEITKDTNETIDKMEELIGIEINPDSPKQISELLYNEYTSDPPCDICKEEVCTEKCETYKIWEKYGHKNPNIDIREKSFEFPIPERTETGQPSSGKSSLKRFIHYEPKNEWQEVGLDFIDLLLHYKKVSKLKTSFVDGLKDSLYDDGRVHPSFNSLAAKSGRASSSDPNCYDEKTQILTDEGWKFFKNLNKNEKVAQWHNDGTIDFVYPNNYINEYYEGTMKYFKSSKVNLLVTPNHRMYSLTRDNNLIVEQIKEFPDLNNRIYDRKNIRGGNLKGSKSLTKKEKIELEKAIIIQADGYLIDKGNICTIRVSSDRKKRQIKSIFNNINYENNGRIRVSINKNHSSFDWLKIDNDNKRIKKFNLNKLLKLDKESREWFLKTIHKWDGDYTRENIYNQHKRNEKTVEDVQIIALLTNKSTSWYIKQNDYRAVNINNKPYRYFSRTTVEDIDFKGRVYSVSVPTGAVVVRRNGNAVISGNSQQLPDQDEEDKYKIRKMFRADKGKVMIASDFDNLEMKLLAHFSKDPKLLQTFEEGHDSHGATAVNVLGLDCHPDEAKKLYPTERNIGKTLNFALMYGMSPHTLYYTLMDYGVDLEDEDLQDEYNAYSGQDLARTIYKRYFNSYTKVKDLIDKQIGIARENEYVESLLGRKIWIPEINSNEAKYRSYGERLATNGKIQASAADVIMQSQVNIENNDKLKELGVEQLMQIHDEVVVQVPKENLEESLKYIKKEMENPFKGKVDTLVDLTVSMDTGKNYFEAK